MARRPSRRTLAAHALRVGAVVLVVAGYLAAFSATPTGQGLALLPHLALDPDLPLTAPALVVEARQERPALATLRVGTGHGGATRSWARAPEPAPARLWGPDGRRAHEGVVRGHDTPAPHPVEVPTLSLDKHRVPAPTVVPAPPPSVVAFDGLSVAVESVDLAVETPPPIGRG